MRELLNKFTSRIVLAELTIHLLLMGLLLLLVIPRIENNYRQQFINHAYADAQRTAGLIAQEPERPYHLIESLNNDNLARAELMPPTPGNVAEHRFGDDNDSVFYIASPLTLGDAKYMLRIAYDERPTAQLMADARNAGFIIAALYLLSATLIASLLGPVLSRPLQQLSAAARKIAAGLSSERLHVHTPISEINTLATDLEHMRRELVNQGEAVATREARISAIMDNVVDALITLDEQGLIQSFNLAAERIFGYDAEEVVGQDIDMLFTSPFYSPYKARIQKNSPPLEQPQSLEILGRRKDGSSFNLEARLSEMCQIEECLSIVVCRDITDRKQSEMELKSLQEDLERRVIKRTRELATVNKELQHQALHDALTELPNRALLQDRLQQATRTAKRDGHALALMLMDLDRFKEINDTLGHHYGDLLLQQVAVRMRSALRDSDTVARLGGDEFAVLLPIIQHPDQAEQAARKVVEVMASPFSLEGQQFHVGISIGIALYPKDGEDSVHLMRRADVAMYVAKRSQIGYTFYDPSQDLHSVSRLAMVGELRRALEASQLKVHYQPTADLRKNKITGVEALVRWDHPQKGAIMPDEFIPLAEHTGLIKPLTVFVLNEALHQAHLWNNNGLFLRMAVNLSARSLHDPDLVTHVAGSLDRWNIPAEQLQMEITESAIMEDPIRAMTTLTKLNRMGVKLSIDDFGTGYSSLMYLKQLPVEEIKIDKSFVKDMLINNEDKVIVRSTIDLAHNMGHQVIAEGVDNEAALELLREMGCDLAQGYYIGTPMTAAAIPGWLKHTSWKTNTHPITAFSRDSIAV